MKSKCVLLAVVAGALLSMVAAWGRFEIKLRVPDDFRGVIKIDEQRDGGELDLFFPLIDVGRSGVVHLQSVKRFYGLRRVVGYWAASKRRIPTRFDHSLGSGTVCIWNLPASVNAEAYFFVGTAGEYAVLMGDNKFLQELGRDRRNSSK
jgi:hypothetical protein